MACRSTLIFILLTSTVTLIHGMNFDHRKAKTEEDVPTEEECMKPPMRKFGHECCILPKERIWGDMQGSVRMCLKKLNVPMNDENAEVAPAEETDMQTTTTETNHSYRRSPKKSLSERIKEIFSTVRQKFRNSMKALQETVILITDRGRHYNDSCFMECVFEDQGFLTEKLVNKVALFTRLDQTLNMNEKWHKAAVAAVEECSQKEVQTEPGSPCQSGSEQIFRCVFKNLFFNCPTWIQNDYCTSLKKFYNKCPNGPPPEMDHTESSMEMTTETEPETEPETE